jgi:hypothetical protein
MLLNPQEIQITKELITKLFFLMDRCEFCFQKEFNFQIIDNPNYPQEVQELCKKFQFQLDEVDLYKLPEDDDE